MKFNLYLSVLLNSLVIGCSTIAFGMTITDYFENDEVFRVGEVQQQMSRNSLKTPVLFLPTKVPRRERSPPSRGYRPQIWTTYI